MIQQIKIKSVKSINPCESVIQTVSDIVKAHGGELKVETKEGEASEFIIQLPDSVKFYSSPFDTPRVTTMFTLKQEFAHVVSLNLILLSMKRKQDSSPAFVGTGSMPPGLERKKNMLLLAKKNSYSQIKIFIFYK